MRKTCFIVGLSIALVIVSLSCKKSEKAESIEIPPEAVRIKIQGAETASAIPLLFKLDGKVEDWAGIEPFWAEGGAPGQGLGESSIDIKSVYFKNDARYLYVFMRIFPTIKERFKKSPSGDIVGNLFLDTDNNPKTGSNAAEGRESDLYKGYEIRVWIPVGVLSGYGKSVPTVSYEIYTHEGGFRGINVADRQNSMDEGSLMAHGPDGIEFALKLEAMKLTVPSTFRVMLAEHSHFDEDAGHSVGQLTLEVVK
jgi:hypothetical protein